MTRTEQNLGAFKLAIIIGATVALLWFVSKMPMFQRKPFAMATAQFEGR